MEKTYDLREIRVEIRVADNVFERTNDTVTFMLKNMPYEQVCETQPLNYSRYHRRVPKLTFSFDPDLGEPNEKGCTHFKKGYQWLFKVKVSGSSWRLIKIGGLRLVYDSSDGKTNYDTPGRDACRNGLWFSNSPQRDQWCIFSLHGQNKQLVVAGYASERVFTLP